jgi:hypothetical protein
VFHAAYCSKGQGGMGGIRDWGLGIRKMRNRRSGRDARPSELSFQSLIPVPESLIPALILLTRGSR